MEDDDVTSGDIGAGGRKPWQVGVKPDSRVIPRELKVRDRGSRGGDGNHLPIDER